MKAQFDSARFFRALDRQRQESRLTWRQLGRELGVSPSTFSRLARGRNPDVDTLVTLTKWLGTPADDFVVGDRGLGKSALAEIASLLRADPHLAPTDVEPLEEIMRVAYTRFRRSSE